MVDVDRLKHRWRIRDVEHDRSVLLFYDHRLMRPVHRVACYWARNHHDGCNWTIQCWTPNGWRDLNPAQSEIMDRIIRQKIAAASSR